MVKGIDIFQEYFREYTDQYVLIGGAACSVSFEEQEISFGRTTKDLDVVLIVEVQTKEFGERFWQFIKDGKYRNRAKSSGEPQFYRFDKPEDPRFPKMIELFSRTDYLFIRDKAGLTPIHIDDSVSSLSAILLNDAYYQALLEGREIMMGISVLKPEWIIPFKQAWLDLRDKLDAASADVKKHRNDIIRIVSELPLKKCALPEEVRSDMEAFVEEFDVTEAELKNLKIRGTKPAEIKETLREIYLID